MGITYSFIWKSFACVFDFLAIVSRPIAYSYILKSRNHVPVAIRNLRVTEFVLNKQTV